MVDEKGDKVGLGASLQDRAGVLRTEPQASQAKPLIASASERVIDCPRCYEPCGWCGDYRHMHGTLRMPNDNKRRYCTIPAMAPEGGECPMCHGDMKVVETRSYARTPQEPT